ncbi:hypothetical protein ACHAWF_007362 [Thalassiosira exigua]
MSAWSNMHLPVLRQPCHLCTLLLRLVEIPRSSRHHSHSPLLRAVNEPVPALRVEPRDVHVVVAARERAHVRHPPLRVVHGRDGMAGRVRGPVARRRRGDGLPHPVPEEDVLGRRGELDARHPRGLGPVEGRGGEERPEAGVTAHALGADDAGLQGQGLAVGRGAVVEAHGDDVGDVPSAAAPVGRVGRCRDREGVGDVERGGTPSPMSVAVAAGTARDVALPRGRGRLEGGHVKVGGRRARVGKGRKLLPSGGRRGHASAPPLGAGHRRRGRVGAVSVAVGRRQSMPLLILILQLLLTPDQLHRAVYSIREPEVSAGCESLPIPRQVEASIVVQQNTWNDHSGLHQDVKKCTADVSHREVFLHSQRAELNYPQLGAR